MWLREGNGQTGRLSNGLCSGQGSRKKISGRSECVSAVIPRSLLRGASLGHSVGPVLLNILSEGAFRAFSPA
jgi:hypothetical protein